MCSSHHDCFPSFVAFPHNFLRLHILVFHTVVPESICFWIIKQVHALGKSLHPLLPLDVLRVRNWEKVSCVFGDCCFYVRVGCNADGICNMLCSSLRGELISGTPRTDPDRGIIYRVSGCCRDIAYLGGSGFLVAKDFGFCRRKPKELIVKPLCWVWVWKEGRRGWTGGVLQPCSKGGWDFSGGEAVSWGLGWVMCSELLWGSLGWQGGFCKHQRISGFHLNPEAAKLECSCTTDAALVGLL